jgi:hypothetical protein
LQYQFAAHGKETPEPFAYSNLTTAGLGDFCNAPDRDLAPILLGREKIPVANLVTAQGVTDIVGSQTELVDGNTDLPVL